ncbi:MAG: glycoside hydrolase family 15 protein [Vicinamibacteria bacterium]|nr:glycoside hydrolase family 15 protein [Vicinamibacteria bacterium]
MRLEDLGLVGNCQFSALIHRGGTVAWCCLPRFDSEPLFSSLLDAEGGGRFEIAPESGEMGEQRYLENTNVLETRFETRAGAFRILDFAPRFSQFDRIFRPTQLFRIVEPLEGTPRIRVSCEPRLGWSKGIPDRLFGSNHVRYEGFASHLRLTSDVPASYLGGQPFALTARRHLVLSWGAPVEEALAPLASRFLGETIRYWQSWVKHCNVPPAFQREVIRSALVLKLHCFEDTGAIVAAMTTSLPEAPGSGRTWDYRYCWLRDAYYSLGAFRLLGHFEEREHFVNYLFDIAGGAPDLNLAPLYRIDGRSDLGESTLPAWPGYEGNGPVRVGNAAAEHLQNDIFGEMVLALAPVYLDERFQAERSSQALALLTRLARRAIEVAGSPDAGIWEYRTQWKPQTFSTLMCWAGADRMARVAKVHAPALAPEFEKAAATICAQIVREAWSEKLDAFASNHGGNDLDASLLQMATLRLLPPDSPRIHRTIDAIQDGLSRDGWLYRYRADDGFGSPQVAFVICSFWLVEALARVGRLDEARRHMDRITGALSPLGLLAEDYDTGAKRMWGNFPQAYSHVGLIHAAFAASPPWSEVL